MRAETVLENIQLLSIKSIICRIRKQEKLGFAIDPVQNSKTVPNVRQIHS